MIEASELEAECRSERPQNSVEAVAKLNLCIEEVLGAINKASSPRQLFWYEK